MTVSELVKKLNAVIYNQYDDTRKIVDIYIGDFLSNVMGKAKENDAWLTVMNNVNVCAVASLNDIAVIVLLEGIAPSLELLEKCKQQKVNLIGTKLWAFDAVKAVL